MAEIEAPYSTHLYNELPGILPAYRAFQTKNGPGFVENIIKPLIAKYRLESVLGISLLHRHCYLEDGERMVGYNGVSIPWASCSTDDPAEGGVYPTAWLVNDGDKLVPYEFTFAASRTKDAINFDADAVKSFTYEFVGALKDAGLEKVVGLCLFPYRGFRGGLEITKGRVNIFLSPGEFTEEQAKSCPHTAWYFDPDFTEYQCYQVCYWKAPTHTYKGHNTPIKG